MTLFHAGIVLDGRYELSRCLHASPMSRVYEAWDRETGRRTAIKVAREGFDTHLKWEAVAIGTLRHGRIVRAIGSGFVDGAYFLALEMLDGQSLEYLLKSDGWLPCPLAVKIAAEALEGLEAIHQAGIVHRDIKPDNLMLTSQGVKIIDLGLVVPEASRGIEDGDCAIGTPLYMSPEQVGGQRVDARADLYAVGHVLYRMLTGRSALPHVGNAMEVMRMQALLAPTPFEEAAPDSNVPRRLRGAVMRALEKRREDRFRSAAEMRVALLEAVP